MVKKFYIEIKTKLASTIWLSTPELNTINDKLLTVPEMRRIKKKQKIACCCSLFRSLACTLIRNTFVNDPHSSMTLQRHTFKTQWPASRTLPHFQCTNWWHRWILWADSLSIFLSLSSFAPHFKKLHWICVFCATILALFGDYLAFKWPKLIFHTRHEEGQGVRERAKK